MVLTVSSQLRPAPSPLTRSKDGLYSTNNKKVQEWSYIAVASLSVNDLTGNELRFRDTGLLKVSAEHDKRL